MNMNSTFKPFRILMPVIARKFFPLAVALLFSLYTSAHSVTAYSSSCGAGPQYIITATVADVNSSSNYRWQWKNPSGAWVCFANGANTINGNSYNVSGAVYNLTTTPGPLVFTNPNSGLQGLEIRMVISDGNGVNPCNLPSGNTWTSSSNHFINLTGTSCSGNSSCYIGGINLGKLTGYFMLFTDAGTDANWQGASKGFLGNVAIDGIQAAERTSGTVPYAGTLFTNDVSLNAWQTIVNANSGQAFSSLNQGTVIAGLTADLENTFAQINALTATPGYTSISASSLDGLDTENGVAQTFVINITSGFSISSKIDITGDAGDVFILRWDTDADFSNGYNGQVKFQSGGAIVPWGGLKPSNFIHVAGDIASSGGGSNPSSPYPQGPRYNNGTGSLISGGSNFSGGGFYTGYWFTTGSPTIFPGGEQPYGETTSLSNAIIVGGWYTKTTKFSITSGMSGVYISPQSCSAGVVELGDRVWYDANNDGILNSSEDGIANITVRLYKDDNNDNVADGAFIATDITDGDGYYSFTGLAPGNYIVGVVVPNGYTSSSVNAGDPDNNTNNDDNGQVLTGNEIRGLAITLSAGAEPNGTYTNTNTNNTYDFGLLADCSCANNAGNLLVNPSFENGTTGWSWSNGSLTTGTGYIACGAKDVTMTPGSTVTFSGFSGTHTGGISCSPKLSLLFLNAAGTVLSQSDVTVTRDVDINFGQLEFYTITAVAPAGTAKVRVQNSITCNTLKIDALCLTAIQPASLGDRVWKDDNRNGIQDAGEAGVSGVTLQLYNSDGQLAGTTVTDGTGIYKFSNLLPDNYTVKLTPPAEYFVSPKTQGGDTNLDNDFDAITYTTGTVSLTAGQNRTDIDAGIFKLINLTGNVWHDVNAMSDGFVNNSGAAQNPPAATIPVGLRAYLVNTATGVVEQVTFVNTDNGTFSFFDLKPNSIYSVVLSSSQGIVGNPPPASILPNGWIHTGQKNANPPNSPAGSDGLNDGILIVPVGTTDVINANFGIRLKGGDIVIG
jgi:hypothetical protein